ncbi:hypothetical protein PVAP13_4KG352400 [Panicum virgatum]|uniref:Uncharacterized protein n=1 Tax=Panicum virgatum TaxID=38727 RepID=A0A8T0TZM9_PANVG|nr:hypothetical protein PVAP13_4KG352400 [Panicum virgatum]
MLGGGGGGGAGLGLDFSAVIQAAVVGLVLFSAAIVAVRRAASRYFVVDAAGFAASYDDHHHHHSPPAYPMSPKGSQLERGPAGGEASGPCAACGVVTSKKCSRCKRVRYCSQECQTKHWQDDHKSKCKPMNADKLSFGFEANSKKSSGFGRISLVPTRKKLKKDFDFIPCGLLNCGNSCFANVVLQCLSCTRPLVAYLLGKDHSRECSTRHEDWCFLCELQCHVQRASESIYPFSPVNILSHLPNIGGNLGYGRQEDAHEFMRFAIDKMQSACLDEYGGEKAVDLNMQETTIIQHIFGGRLQSQVQCTACGMVSNRYDNMMDLTVEIQGDAESLEKCLDQFTAVEWLDGDNKYKCDGCNDYVKARKHLSVHQAPNILTITLKRFQSGRFGKLNKRVTFPMNLDLTPYMSSTDGSDLYDLYAVVVHLDMLNASFFGHYICYIKGSRGNWYKIDDCKVMIVDEEEVHAQGAYMLLYSRRTARPRPLATVEEPVKQPQQCKVLPLNGQNHMILELEDATLICESPLESSDLLQQVSESNNESLHKMDIKDQESDLDIHTSIEADKLISDEVDLLGSPVSHVLEDTRAPCSTLEASTSLRSVPLCPQVEGGPATMSSGNSMSEASSDHSFAEEREEPASCNSVDYMDVDTEAGTEVERCDERPPALDGSIGRTDNKTSVPILANEMAGKPRSTFSPGFLNKPSRKRSSFAEEDRIGGNNAGSSRKLNGHCNEYISSSEQVLANSCGNSPSSGSENCNGDMFATSRNGNYYTFNGVTQSSKHSLHADKLDVPLVSHGFEPRPYSEPSSGSSKNCSSTSSGKPLKACQGDMSFLSRGFLGRPPSRGNSVKAADRLSFGNGTSSSLGNGNNKPSNDSRESAVLGTRSDIRMEQKSNGATVVPEHVEERCSDCTINGSSFQLRAAPNHLDENSHAILASNNTSCRQENGSNGVNGVGCQRDGAPSMLVSKNSTGSEHDGLRRRVTSKFFEQNGIDAQ